MSEEEARALATQIKLTPGWVVLPVYAASHWRKPPTYEFLIFRTSGRPHRITSQQAWLDAQFQEATIALVPK